MNALTRTLQGWGLITAVGIALPAAAQESAPTADAPSAGDPADFNRALRTVEENVHALKEQVFRSKATLQLLQEIVVQGSATGARSTIWHENKLGRSYTVESIRYFLDGQPKFVKVDTDNGLDDLQEVKVFEGAVPPGSHQLVVNMRLRGNGYGIFSYVEQVQLTVQATTTFTAEEGKSCSVRALLDERKGLGRSFTERPAVQFETQCVRLSGAASDN
ncbi:MAG TPA: dihydrolipoamide acetyltransferase [Deltaproteobacteria bacterium]|nr:dihydrolipoamide acetyltransferase [Deltaproteobacteria bacterium]